MPVVIVPPPFQGPTQGVARVEVVASTVREVVDAMDSRYPGFAPLILDQAGGLHPFAQVFRNGEPVAGEALGEPIEEADEIEIVAAIAGG